MDDLLAGLGPDASRMWSDLIGRLTGPMTFRLVLQPAMAAFYGVRDGLKDARSGKPAYFWSIMSHPSEGTRLLREGWHAVLRVILLGAVMDIVYQALVFRRVYPLQLVIVVLTLAFVPYLLVRGPANRIARWMHSHRTATTP
jgi:hypothetical protein